MRLRSLRAALRRTARVGIFSLVLLALVMPAASAATTRLWVKRYDGWAKNVDEAADLGFDSSGNVYVAGRSVAVTTGYDYLVIKYGPGGGKKWVRRYDGPAHAWDAARAIAVDAAGNVYVTGVSTSPRGGKDIATVKYDASGTRVWVKRYGNGAYYDEAKDIAIDTAGNVIVVGSSAAKYSGKDIVTIKYGPDGSVAWVRRYNGPASDADVGTAVAVDSANNVYVTGPSIGEETEWDVCTIKYSPAGAQLWVNRWDGRKHRADGSTDIAIDSNDRAYVTGYTYRNADDTDFVTIAYGKYGGIRWEDRYDGPEEALDVAWAIAIDGNGVYVAGSSEGEGTGYDYCIIRYLRDGTVSFARRYIGPAGGDDMVNDIAAANGRAYVTGFSEGEGTGGDYLTIAYGGRGVVKWTNRYNGPSAGFDQGNAVGVCPATGNVFVTGGSGGVDTKSDFATIGYTP
jgi:hypothetical protein